MRILVVGDVLLDRDVEGESTRLAPDAPVPVVDVRQVRERAGGAGLAAQLLCRPGIEVALACVAADDPAGLALAGRLPPGLRLVRLGTVPGTRTVTRIRAGGQSLVRVDEPVPALAPAAALDAAALSRELARADAVLVADYGAGLTRHPLLRKEVRGRRSGAPLVWDPHPRGARPVPGCTVVTPSRAEAERFAGGGSRVGGRSHTAAGGTATGRYGPAPDQLAGRLRERWQAHAVAVTAGVSGVFCALADSPPLFTPTPSVCPGDPVGAGDRFAGTLTAALAAGAVISEAVGLAVDDVAGWLWAGGVAAVGGDGPDLAARAEPADGPDLAARAEPADGLGRAARAEPPGRPDPLARRRSRPEQGDGLAAAIRLAWRVRARGGTVVATGGCFDLLHAGHVESLQAARRLGDCLVVLLNSDDSIRRIKGPDRPVNRAADRRRVLEALDCVDAVAVFDTDTPAPALEVLRPQVWAKGGDYATASLPEAQLLPRWGGRVVVLPYLSGRSTTTILDRLKETRT